MFCSRLPLPDFSQENATRVLSVLFSLSFCAHAWIVRSAFLFLRPFPARRPQMESVLLVLCCHCLSLFTKLVFFRVLTLCPGRCGSLTTSFSLEFFSLGKSKLRPLSTLATTKSTSNEALRPGSFPWAFSVKITTPQVAIFEWTS